MSRVHAEQAKSSRRRRGSPTKLAAHAFTSALLCLASAAPSWAAPTCAPVATLVVPGKAATAHHPAESPKHAYRLADGSIVFLGRLAIDADGSPKAYNPDGVSGQDYLSNGGHAGDWWALATDAPECGHAGSPLVQQASDPDPGFYVTTTTLVDATVTDCRKQRRYVNSDRVSYVALAPSIARIRGNKGNLVAVLAPGVTASQVAILADGAPRTGIGEGSMELARRLGVSASPKHGGLDDRTLTYVVLPQMHAFPQSEDALILDGQSAFAAWGGNERLAVCRTALAGMPK